MAHIPTPGTKADHQAPNANRAATKADILAAEAHHKATKADLGAIEAYQKADYGATHADHTAHSPFTRLRPKAIDPKLPLQGAGG